MPCILVLLIESLFSRFASSRNRQPSVWDCSNQLPSRLCLNQLGLTGSSKPVRLNWFRNRFSSSFETPNRFGLDKAKPVKPKPNHCRLLPVTIIKYVCPITPHDFFFGILVLIFYRHLCTLRKSFAKRSPIRR